MSRASFSCDLPTTVDFDDLFVNEDETSRMRQNSVEGYGSTVVNVNHPSAQMDAVPSGKDEMPDSPPKESFVEKLKKYSVIEPYIFFLMVGVNIRLVVDTELLFVKSCVTEKGLDREFCAALTKEKNATLFTEVETIATNFNAMCSYMDTIPSGLISILIGSFSDKYGMKIPLTMAAIGLLLELVGMMFSVLYFESSPWWIVASKLVGSIAGGTLVAILTSYAYLSANSTTNDRSTRFAIFQTLRVIGTTGSVILSGFIFSNNYVTIYSIAIVATFLAVVIIQCRMNEGPSKMKGMTFGQVLRDFFSIGAVKDSCEVMTKSRHGNHRAQIWIIMAQQGLITLAMLGVSQQSLYYTMRRYGWDANVYSFVHGIFKLTSALMAPVAILIFAKVLKLQDHTVAIISMLSQCAEFIVCGLAPIGWMFGVGYAFGALGGMVVIPLSSYVTRLLDKDEMSRAFVMLSIVNIVVPLVATQVMADVYTFTKETVVGAMFFMSAGIIVIPMFLSLWVRIWGIPPQESLEDQPSKEGNTTELTEDWCQDQRHGNERSRNEDVEPEDIRC